MALPKYTLWDLMVKDVSEIERQLSTAISEICHDSEQDPIVFLESLGAASYKTDNCLWHKVARKFVEFNASKPTLIKYGRRCRSLFKAHEINIREQVMQNVDTRISMTSSENETLVPGIADDVRPNEEGKEENSEVDASKIIGSSGDENENLTDSLEKSTDSASPVPLQRANIVSQAEHGTSETVHCEAKEDEEVGTKPESGLAQKAVDVHHCQSPDIFSSTNYPVEFPNIQKIIYDIPLKVEDWKSLEKGKWLNDNIINCFFFLMRDAAEKKNFRVFVFDTLIVGALLHNTKFRSSELRYASNANLWEQDVWLLPIHASNHWTLLVVDLKNTIMTYLDSLHGSPPPRLFEKLFYLLDCISDGNNGGADRIDWKNWEFFTPQDIIRQSYNNSGVFVCIWAYVICCGMSLDFDDSYMECARKSIAEILNRSHVEKQVRTASKRKSSVLEINKFVGLDNVLKAQSIPPLKFENTMSYCSSLHFSTSRAEWSEKDGDNTKK